VSGWKAYNYQLPMSAGNIKDKRDRGNRGTLHSEQYIYNV